MVDLGQLLPDWLLVMPNGWAKTLSPSFPYLSGELSGDQDTVNLVVVQAG